MSYVLLNEELVEAGDAKVPIADRGLLLADGLFETCLAQGGQVVCLSAHLQRMRDGAKLLQIPVPYDNQQIEDHCQLLLNKNGLADETAAIRITLTRGVGGRGIKLPSNPQPTMFITAVAYQSPAEPAKVIVASHTWTKIPPLSNYKTLNYQDSIIARLEAEEAGADDAIMCNTAGRVVCTTVGNIFLLIDGTWVTPPISDGALPGIARAKKIAEAKAAGDKIVVRSVEHHELAKCQAAYLTNSLVGRRDIVIPLT